MKPQHYSSTSQHCIVAFGVVFFLLASAALASTIHLSDSDNEQNEKEYVVHLQQQILQNFPNMNKTDTPSLNGFSPTDPMKTLNPTHLALHSVCVYYGMKCPREYIAYLEEIATHYGILFTRPSARDQTRNASEKHNGDSENEKAVSQMKNIMALETEVVYSSAYIQQLLSEHETILFSNINYSTIDAIKRQLSLLRVKEEELRRVQKHAYDTDRGNNTEYVHHTYQDCFRHFVQCVLFPNLKIWFYEMTYYAQTLLPVLLGTTGKFTIYSVMVSFLFLALLPTTPADNVDSRRNTENSLDPLVSLFDQVRRQETLEQLDKYYRMLRRIHMLRLSISLFLLARLLFVMYSYRNLFTQDTKHNGNVGLSLFIPLFPLYVNTFLSRLFGVIGLLGVLYLFQSILFSSAKQIWLNWNDISAHEAAHKEERHKLLTSVKRDKRPLDTQ